MAEVTKDKVSEVFELLKRMTTPASGETSMTAETVPAPNVDNSLLYPWEPDFMDGYAMSTYAGSVITLDQIWDAYVAGENIALVGPSGCGKSTIAFHLLDKANDKVRAKNREIYQRNITAIKAGKTELEGYHPLPYPLAHFSCTKQTRVENLEGSLTFEMKDGVRMPVVILGAMTDAWTNGKTLILEEMDMPLPGVWATAHQYFDLRTNETFIYVNGPQKLLKNKRFRVIATMNTLGKGENQMDFADTEVQNGAFLKRFTYWVVVGWLPREKEVALLTSHSGLRKDIVEGMVAAAIQTRTSKEEEAVDTAISTRELKSWARECKRAEKRCAGADKMAYNNYWTNIVIQSAYPTILNPIADQNTRAAYERFLSIR